MVILGERLADQQYTQQQGKQIPCQGGKDQDNPQGDHFFIRPIALHIGGNQGQRDEMDCSNRPQQAHAQEKGITDPGFKKVQAGHQQDQDLYQQHVAAHLVFQVFLPFEQNQPGKRTENVSICNGHRQQYTDQAHRPGDLVVFDNLAVCQQQRQQGDCCLHQKEEGDQQRNCTDGSGL